MSRKPEAAARASHHQPEVAAEAIVWAYRVRRREVWVGPADRDDHPGTKSCPWLLDLYLGRKGYETQLRSAPAEEGRPDNLMEPVEGDYGAQGPFDQRSQPSSLQLWLTKHRGVAAGSLAGILTPLLLDRREGRSGYIPEKPPVTIDN